MSRTVLTTSLVLAVASAIVLYAVFSGGGAPPAAPVVKNAAPAEHSSAEPLRGSPRTHADDPASEAARALVEGGDGVEEPSSSLESPTRVSARVEDDQGGRLPNVRVLCRVAEEEVEAFSVSDGAVELNLSLPAGARVPCTFELSCPRFASVRHELVLVGGQDAFLGTWVLHRAGAVLGRVTDRRGQGLSGVSVARLNADVTSVEWPSVRRLAPLQIPGVEPEGVTDADGRFSLEGFPRGEHRVVAAHEGYFAGLSEVFSLEPDGQVVGLAIVLEPAPATGTVHGRVIDSDDRPVPHVRLFVQSKRASMRLGANAYGDFSFPGSGGPFTVETTDPRGLCRGRTVEGLRSEGSPYEIRLETAARIVLDVRTSEGAPVENWAAVVWNAEERRILAEWDAADTADPAADSIPAPSEDFVVEILADRRSPSRSAAQSSERPPAVLGFRLEPARGLHGVVRSADGPVGGATVSLHEAYEPRVRSDPFPLRRTPSFHLRTTTADDGRFVLPPRWSGEFYVVATTPRGSTAEVGPLRLAPGDHHERDLAIEAPSSLAVRVRSTRGDDVGGRVVGLSFANASIRSERTSIEGRATFAALTPGTWYVALLDDDPDPSAGYSIVFEDWKPNAGQVVVELPPAEQVEVDLWIEGAPDPCQLAVLARLDDRAPPGWSVRTESEQGRTTIEQLSLAGEAELTLPEPGSYRVALLPAPDDGATPWIVLGDLELLPGSNSWDVSLSSGELTGVVPPARLTSDERLWLLTSTATAEVYVPVDLAADGSFRLEPAPAGPGRLVALPAAGRLEDSEPRILASVEVPVGESAEIDLR